MNNHENVSRLLHSSEPAKHSSDNGITMLSAMSHFCEVLLKVNVSEQRITCISPSCQGLFGFSPAYFINGGQQAFFKLWLQYDLKIYHDHIFPTDCRFLKNYNGKKGNSLLSTFNFTCNTKYGNNISLLLKTIYTVDDTTKLPVEALCWLSPIDYFINEQAITHVIQILDDSKGLISPPLFKTSYYGNKDIFQLSRREKEIYCAIVEGLNTKEIATKFCLSIFTINNHRKSILEKIKCKNAGELIKNALQQHFEKLYEEIKIPVYKTKKILLDISSYWVVIFSINFTQINLL